tara:strand:+ start:241 stop:432 length:192 start_codon:yes stop_codon:yes gene_type:complete
MNKPTLQPVTLEIAKHVIDITDKPTRPTSAEMLVIRRLATLVEAAFDAAKMLNEWDKPDEPNT